MVETVSQGNWPVERRFTRSRVKLRAALFVTGDFTYTDLLQISEGGLLFKSDRDLEPGSYAELHFFVNEDSFITVKGEVIYRLDNNEYCQGSCYGMRFLMLRSHDRILIKKLVEQSGTLG